MDWTLILRVAGVVIFSAGAVAIFRPMPLLSRRWRAGCVVAIGLIVLTAGIFSKPPGWCGCQLPPIPNIMLFNLGTKLLKQGNYAEAKSAFDDLLHDWKSDAIHPAATYGRALSEEKLGETAAAQKDFATAATFKPSGATQFKQYGS
jgi:TolA-binding protein